jgi:hypothetical protein
MLHPRPLRVLVFHGPDSTYKFELLAWLRGPDVQADARSVGEMPPNTSGSFDERVDSAIAWADKAIALVTSDSRSCSGAPNVIDEIGRWRGTGRSESLAIVSHRSITEYSNLAGIVRIEFHDRVNEAFLGLSKFLGLLSPREIGVRQLKPIRIQHVLDSWKSRHSSIRRDVYIVVGGSEKYDAQRKALGLKEYQSTAPVTGVVRVSLALAQAGAPLVDAICDYELPLRSANVESIDLIVVGAGDTNRVSKEIFVHDTSRLPLRFEPSTSSDTLVSTGFQNLWSRSSCGAIFALEQPLPGTKNVIICAGNAAQGTNAALTTVAGWLGGRITDMGRLDKAIGVVVESSLSVQPLVLWTADESEN